MFELVTNAQTIVQPPRDVQISAGIVLAILAISVTFIVLGILTISIKLMSIGVAKYYRRKEKIKAAPLVAVEKPAVPEVKTAPEISAEEAVAAVVAVHRYLTEKVSLTQPQPLKAVGSYWVMSWRINACENLNDYDYILKSRRLQRFKKYIV